MNKNGIRGAANQGERTFEKDGRTITETKRMAGDRLTVTLTYGPDLPPDIFEWQLYTPDEIATLATACGFQPLLICSSFDETQLPSPAVARMQLLLRR